MSDQDSNENQLNQSRFLIEQLNLEQQPTQQEVLERAEQLEIDDLILAKESLTKQLQPEWRPYCNRHQQIFYINLLEKLAYVDHPIDMFFKKQYAKSNNIPIPRFKSFKLEEVSSNLELIEQEIRNFKSRSHKTTLRIVYEQPSQQQAISSHPKSPANEDEYQFEFEKEKQKQEISVQQAEQLLLYERKLEQQYERQLTKRKKQLKAKQKMLVQDHQKCIKSIIDQKVEEVCLQYDQEIRKKNKIDLKKQKQKLSNEYQQKRLQFCQNIQKFNTVFQKLREKQRSIQTIYESRNASERMAIVQDIQQMEQLQKIKAIELAKAKAMKQFNQRLLSINLNSSEYQKNLKKSLQDLYKQIDIVGLKRTSERREIFKPSRGMKQGREVERDLQYEILKKQIKDLCVWSNQDADVRPSYENPSKSLKSSLNLRLRMRII